jgi:hypothetical protein
MVALRSGRNATIAEQARRSAHRIALSQGFDSGIGRSAVQSR